MELEVSDVHSAINNVPVAQLDKTHEKGPRTVDSIAASVESWSA